MNADLNIAEKGSVGSRVAGNTGMMVAAKAAAAVFGLFSLIIATRSLPVADIGIILFLHAWMLFFAEVATFQSWQAVIRFGTPYIEAGQTGRLARLLRFCIALDFVGAAASFILSISGLLWLGKILPHLAMAQNTGLTEQIDKLVPYGLVYSLLILVHQGGASTGLFRLFDKFRPLAAQVLVMPAFRLSGVIIAALVHPTLKGFLTAWFIASLAGYLALPILALLELKSRNLLAHVFEARPSLKTEEKGLWPFVWKANIDASLATGTTHLPLLLVMPIFGPVYVGVYKVAEEISRILSEGMLLLDRVIYPEYARMMTRGQVRNIGRIVIKTGLILLLGGLALSVLTALLGPLIIPKVFGEAYGLAVSLATLLVFAAAILGVAAPLYPVFYAAGRPGLAIFARGAGLVFYIFLVFVMSHVIGQTGPAWAAIGGNLLSVLLAGWMVWRTLETHEVQT